MLKYITIIIIFVLMLFACSDKKSTDPITNDGKKWRIGYYEGGPYKDYQTYFIALVKGLEKLKWIPEVNIPKRIGNSDNREIWDYLSKIDSEYIEFVKEAYWSADWYEEKRDINKLNAIVYLQKKKLDLIIAAGTWAGLDLANNSHQIPVIVISSSDPVRAGIIKSCKDSGLTNVYSPCDPEQYVRQIRVFHNIVEFKKLGIVYEDTPEGRIYASLDDADIVAKEKNFEVITCIARDYNQTDYESMLLMYKCHEELATKVDALYITAHRGTDPKFMPKVLEPLFKYKIPTFAQEGPDQVERGVMLSIARSDEENRGLFNATTIARIFNGETPRNISQIFKEEKRIVINLETARIIGYKIPKSIIDAADYTYKKIEND